MDAEDDDDYNNDRNADGVVFDPQSDLNDSGEEAGGGDDGVQIRTPTPTGARGHGRGDCRRRNRRRNGSLLPFEGWKKCGDHQRSGLCRNC